MQQLIFVLDPMCSWCWGFEPIIKELKTLHAGRFHFSLVMGGLRTKGDMPWTEESRSYLAKNWRAVAQATHQPFNFSILKRRDFEYDTYPNANEISFFQPIYCSGVNTPIPKMRPAYTESSALAS